MKKIILSMLVAGLAGITSASAQTKMADTKPQKVDATQKVQVKPTDDKNKNAIPANSTTVKKAEPAPQNQAVQAIQQTPKTNPTTYHKSAKNMKKAKFATSTKKMEAMPAKQVEKK